MLIRCFVAPLIPPSIRASDSETWARSGSDWRQVDLSAAAADENTVGSSGQVTRATVGGSHVQVAAGDSYRGVSQGGLDQVDRTAAVKGMAGVSVPEPVPA